MRQLLKKGSHPDLYAILIILALVAAFFWRVLFGGNVLLPADALFAFPPWKPFAEQFGIALPHNELISDMILQNYQWKTFAKQSLQGGYLPLWNPYVFAGMPFLAAGQYAVLYPLGVVFYLLPVAQAYGWFTALHVFLGGLFTYIYLRVLGANRLGSLIAAIAFAFSSFLVVSFIWPMVVSTVIWLPLILTFLEIILRRFEQAAHPWRASLVYILFGGGLVGMQLLAGHLEFSFFALFTMAFYASCRLLLFLFKSKRLGSAFQAGLALVVMVAIGFSLAASQLVPFLEVVKENYRSGLVSYEEVVGYAFPKQQILGFVIPDFFGNPTHHEYYDVVDGTTKPVANATDFSGNPMTYPWWSVKNYVEAAGYVGILPLLLAFLAPILRRDRYTIIFSAYAVLCLLLVFGTPLYRLIWLIPGLEQSHSPFRWIFPFTMSVAILAGLGATALITSVANLRAARIIGMATGLLGVSMLLVLALSRVFLTQTLSIVETLLRRSQLLPYAFDSGQMLYSYQFRNLVLLGLFLATSGLLVAYAAGWRVRMGPKPLPRLYHACAVGLLAIDLFIVNYDFNSVTDPKLVDFIPPSLASLQTDPDLFRITTFGYEDSLKPNSGMQAGLQDVRGYDSVILKQYSDFWRLMEEPDALLYNTINKVGKASSLESPILDLLNVKYVLTTRNIVLPNYSEVYRGEVNIYRNDDYLPRAFLVGRATFVDSTKEAMERMGQPGFDPRREVVLVASGSAQTEDALGNSTSLPVPKITSYLPNQVTIDASPPEASYLVLSDSFFSGWRAAVDGKEVPVLRADAIFRAVKLGPGDHQVVFTYSPDSIKLGFFGTFVGSVAILLGLAYLGWHRFYPRTETTSTAQRVFKNSVTPMVAQLANKAVDFGYAILVLRFLGLENSGRYSLAIIMAGYFLIVSDFGLGTLLSREVAKAPSAGNRYLSNTIALRMGLGLASLPVIFAVLALYIWQFGLTLDTAATVLLFSLGMFPSGINSALSSVFFAHERMEYPAAVTTVSTLLKVTFGIIALALGWGIIGLGAVSVVVNLITMAILYRMLTAVLFRPKLDIDFPFQRGMLREAFPLMINNLLATIFFRIDVMLLKPMQGDSAVGAYGTAYKFIDGLNFIPSLFTLAIFPVMSRYAVSSRESLVRGFTLSLRLLLLIAIPISVGTTIVAEKVILLLVTEEFRPAILALQILIWFLPFSFVNSVTQYVLIAVGQQRFLTLAFVIGASFNIVGNLIAISMYGFAGAAVMTVLSEIVLMVPFFYAVRKHVGEISLPAVAWRPALASLLMGAVVWQLRDLNLLMVVALAVPAYVLPLILLRTFGSQDVAIARSLVRR